MNEYWQILLLLFPIHILLLLLYIIMSQFLFEPELKIYYDN